MKENAELKILLSDKFGKGLTVKRYKEIVSGYSKAKGLKITNTHLRKDKAELKKQIEEIEIAFKCVNDKNDELNRQITGMAKHIDELEHDIASIKYLDKNIVENIIERKLYIHSADLPFPGDYIAGKKEAVAALCNLAIPPKEKIIKMLKKYQIREIEKFTPKNKGKERCIWERKPEQIASEILGDKEE